MGKRRREPDSDDAAAELAEINTLFVDTSLDTHLAMLVSSADTVSDFKKKLALEHKHCFPEIGEIQVHSLKVKRRSNFYHLPDIMLVWSAFHGAEENWFLSVDASSIHTHLIRNSLELGTSSGVKICMTNTDDDCRGFKSDANRNENLRLALPDGAAAAEKNDDSEMIVGPKVEKPEENMMDSHRNIYSEEHSLGTKSRTKKKLKVRHTEDVSHNSGLGGGDVMFRPDGKNGKPTMSDSIVKVRNDQFNVEDKLVSEEASPPTTAETTHLESIVNSLNLKDSNRRREDNGFKSMMDYELGQDVQADHSGGVSIVVQDSSARLTNASDGGGDAKIAGSKRKKKKVHKQAAEIQNITYMDKIGKDERIKSTSDTHKFDNKEEGKDLSLEHNHEVIMPSNSIVPNHVHPDIALQEASLLQDAEKRNFCALNSQKLLHSDEKKEYNALESKMDNGLDQETIHLGSIVSSQNLKDSNRRKEDNVFKSVMDYELGQDVQADRSGGVSIGDAKTSGSKRKKKKVHKTAAEIQDITFMEQIGNGESIRPTSDTHKFNNKEEGKDTSLEHDREVIMPANIIVSNYVHPDFALKEASFLQDVEKRNFQISNSQKLLDSDKVKEDNVLESKMDNGLDQDFRTMHSGGVILNMPDLSARVMDASGGVEDVNASGKKRKKKVPKITVEVQDTRDVEQIGKGEIKNPCTETNKSEEKEEEKVLSLEHDNEVILTSNSKAPDHVYQDLAPKETSFMQDADAVMGPEISSGAKKEKKKKKSGKKSVGTSITKSGIIEIHNGIRGSSGLPSPSTDLIPKETGKEESVRQNEGNDGQMKLLDSSNHDALEKTQDVNKKEADFVTKTQTEQTLEDVSDGNQKMAEKTQVSVGNCYEDCPTAETENTIMETNQVDKDNENTEIKYRKTTKKRKKQKHTAADVHEKLPVKEKQVGIEPLATMETSIGFINSEHEGRHVGSSQVLSRKSEESVGKMHEIVENTDECAENSGKGNEEINFKKYFLPGEHQHKVTSKDKIKKNLSLDKSSSEQSKTLPSNMRTQRLLSGLNGTNMMQLKTPKKKSLLAKSGAIFQESSGESSGDENGTMHSDDSTLSPSNSSSMSGVSQNSISNGSNGTAAKSRRNTSKMDVSATTMDFILRNSKRFEKAKQLASQSESQPIEFVPDSQLT